LLTVLVVWLVIWLLFFTIPSQRSERYVIPAVPALAILLAVHWHRIARIWFWVTLAVLTVPLVLIARIGWVMGDLGMASASEVGCTVVLACIGLGSILLAIARTDWLRNACLVGCLSIYAGFTSMVHPLDRPEANFSEAIQARTHDWRMAVPNGFTGQYERFHFLLPQSQLIPYDAEGRNTGALYPDLPGPKRLDMLLDQFDGVIWYQDGLNEAEPPCRPACELLAVRTHVKSRHKNGEITLENIWYPQQWLFRHEWLLSRQHL